MATSSANLGSTPSSVSRRELGNDRWAYVVGRLSNFIMFDLERIYERCNDAEVGYRPADSDPLVGDRWGGI